MISGCSDDLGYFIVWGDWFRWRMYLRHTIRKKDGKVHRYWCLVRSVRVGRRVVQQVVAHLGELDEQGRVAARALARHRVSGYGSGRLARLRGAKGGIAALADRPAAPAEVGAVIAIRWLFADFEM